MAQTFRKADRITRRKDFNRVLRRGRCSSNGLLKLFLLPNELGRSRLGVLVGARHGRAVRRNRVRRLCREAFRTCREELPCGYDYIILPRPEVELTLQGVRRSLLELAARLTRRSRR